VEYSGVTTILQECKYLILTKARSTNKTRYTRCNTTVGYNRSKKSKARFMWY
jgi:hypothetical protein